MGRLAILRVPTLDGSLVIHMLRQFRDSEEFVHPFESQTLRLGHEEPGEDAHGETEASKQDKGAVTALTPVKLLAEDIQPEDGRFLHCDQHVGNRPCDDKIEEPLRRCCEGHVETTESCSRNFRDVNPADLYKQCKLQHPQLRG